MKNYSSNFGTYYRLILRHRDEFREVQVKNFSLYWLDPSLVHMPHGQQKLLQNFAQFQFVTHIPPLPLLLGQ